MNTRNGNCRTDEFLLRVDRQCDKDTEKYKQNIPAKDDQWKENFKCYIQRFVGEIQTDCSMNGGAKPNIPEET